MKLHEGMMAQNNHHLQYTNKNCLLSISIGNCFKVQMSCSCHKIIDSKYLWVDPVHCIDIFKVIKMILVSANYCPYICTLNFNRSINHVFNFCNNYCAEIVVAEKGTQKKYVV